MPGPTGWDENDPAVLTAVDANLRDRVAPLVVDSAQERAAFSYELACNWHREMLHGVKVKPPEAAGGIRSEAWYKGEVHVGGFRGTPTKEALQAVEAFEAAFKDRIAELDAEIPKGETPESDEDVRKVLLLAADLHGEWVRIHPFVNGNGRTARAWANWALLRYGLPPLLLPLRPRPSLGESFAGGVQRPKYGYAAQLSLATGEHRLMYAALIKEYRKAVADKS